MAFGGCGPLKFPWKLVDDRLSCRLLDQAPKLGGASGGPGDWKVILTNKELGERLEQQALKKGEESFWWWSWFSFCRVIYGSRLVVIQLSCYTTLATLASHTILTNELDIYTPPKLAPFSCRNPPFSGVLITKLSRWLTPTCPVTQTFTQC